MFITPIGIPSDLSEASFEDSWIQVTKYSDYKKVSLYVYPFVVSSARKIKNKFEDKISMIIVKPDWGTDMWMVCSLDIGIFSEGA